MKHKYALIHVDCGGMYIENGEMLYTGPIKHEYVCNICKDDIYLSEENGRVIIHKLETTDEKKRP